MISANALERIAHGGRRLVAQPQPDGGRLPGAHGELIVRGSFCSRVLRVDGILLSVHHVVVDPVFDVRAGVGRAEDPLVVRLVLREQQRNISLAVQIALAQLGVRRRDGSRAVLARDLLQGRLRCVRPPCPGVAKPESRQDVKRGRLRPAIAHADLDQDVLRCLLGVLHEHVEVAIAR